MAMTGYVLDSLLNTALAWLVLDSLDQWFGMNCLEEQDHTEHLQINWGMWMMFIWKFYHISNEKRSILVQSNQKSNSLRKYEVMRHRQFVYVLQFSEQIK